MRQQPAVEQQRNPAAHARSDDDPPARRMVSEHVEGLVKPGRDRAIGEFSARFTMTRIVEAQRRPARIASQARKAFRLAAGHVRHEAAQPEETAARHIVATAIFAIGQPQTVAKTVKPRAAH